MKIIDIHTHIYPDGIARKATESIRDFYNIHTGNMVGTSVELNERRKLAGISKCVVLPVAIRPGRVTEINDYIVSELKSYSEFIGFGTVHAAMPNIADEGERILSMGLKGIKMHPDSQQFPIDDIRLFPLYETIQGKVPVLLHMGDERFNYSHPIRLRRILDLFPGLQAIAAHFGGYSMYDQACDILKDTSCVMDISSSLMFMPDGVAEKYINIYGAERMAFGSDYPLWDPVLEVRTFLDLKLTSDQLEQIAHKTAERILRIDD